MNDFVCMNHLMHFLYSVYFLQWKILITKVTSSKILFLKLGYISLFEIIFSVLKVKDVHLKSTLQYKIESKCVRADFTILLTDRTCSLQDEDSCKSVVFRHLGKSLSWTGKVMNLTSNSQNVYTTPLRQWVFRQFLPFSWTTLRGKHCRHPIAVMGVVDTSRQGIGCKTVTYLFCVFVCLCFYGAKENENQISKIQL